MNMLSPETSSYRIFCKHWGALILQRLNIFQQAHLCHGGGSGIVAHDLSVFAPFTGSLIMSVRMSEDALNVEGEDCTERNTVCGEHRMMQKPFVETWCYSNIQSRSRLQHQRSMYLVDI
jgi:hypothetical protein